MTAHKRYKQVLDFIRGYIASNKESPTIKEIGQFVGLRSPASIFDILVGLENLGLITRVPNINRGIRLPE